MAEILADRTISVGAAEIVTFEYISKYLRTDELLTGTPTVAEVDTTDLTIANVGLNSATIPAADLDGVEALANQAVQFKVSGGSANTAYVIKVTTATDSTPARTPVHAFRLRFI